MTITPDGKDWTWVLERQCPECGYDARAVAGHDVALRLREQVPLWTEVLAAGSARTRPGPTTWSPLEYGCHVRDVCTLFDQRLGLMLAEEAPEFANWDQDETAVAEDYAGQDPLAVAVELAAAAESIASSFDEVSADQWSRSGRRSDGATFSVETFARYFLHDVVHHGWDVTTSTRTD